MPSFRDDGLAMRSNGFDDRLTQLLQPRDGTGLVRSDEAAETDDVGYHDTGEAALHKRC